MIGEGETWNTERRIRKLLLNEYSSVNSTSDHSPVAAEFLCYAYYYIKPSSENIRIGNTVTISLYQLGDEIIYKDHTINWEIIDGKDKITYNIINDNNGSIYVSGKSEGKVTIKVKVDNITTEPISLKVIK